MIKKVLSKMLLSIMLFVFLFTNTSMAAVIITSEKSTDNDEADQQIEIDATSNATADQEGEEVATIKQKIEKELETQMKEGIAVNAKSKINTQIYINESTILGDIGRAWKEVVKTEITDERAERIYTVYVENLEEYAGKKIEAWINEYYTNNKDRIVTKVNKYIDGDESMISMAVSTVVYTALDDLEDEMEKLVTQTNGEIGSIVKDVLSQYEKISTWEEKAVEAICLEIPIQIGESLNNIFSQKFSWESEKLTEGLSLLVTSESTVSKEVSNKTIEQLTTYYAEQLGYDVGEKNFGELFVEYGMNIAISQMSGQWKEIATSVREAVFSKSDNNKYNQIFNKAYGEAKDKLETTANNQIKELQNNAEEYAKQGINVKKRINQIKRELQIELEKAAREEDEKTRALLEEKANANYELQMNEVLKQKEELQTDMKDKLNAQVEVIKNEVIKYGDDAFENLAINKVLLQKGIKELDEQLEKDINATKVKWGSKRSDEDQKAFDTELEDEDKRHDAVVAEIKSRGELTQEQKNQKKINENRIEATAAAKLTNLDERFGIKLTPEQETKKANELETNKKNYNESVDKINNDYDELIAKATTKEEKRQLERDRDSALSTAKSEKNLKDKEIEARYETGLKDEDRPAYEAEKKEIKDAKEAELEANDEEFKAPGRTEEEKQQDTADLETENQLHKDIKNEINGKYELPEQTDEQKAREQEEIDSLKRKKKSNEDILENKLKELKRQQKAELNVERQKFKAMQEYYDDWIKNTYNPEKDRLKEAIRNAETDEEKLYLQNQLANLETEKKWSKAGLDKARTELNTKELSIMSAEQKLIAEATAQLVSQIVAIYADEIISVITDQIDEWANKLGSLLGGVVKGINAQVKNWLVTNISNNVTQLVWSLFGKTPNLGFTALSINLTSISQKLLQAWIKSLPLIGDIINRIWWFYG